MATTAPPLTCPQGHGPGIPGSRFCNSCGMELAAAFAPIQPLPAAPAAAPAPSVASQLPGCKQCGGGGVRLESAEVICAECGWLRPLLPDYKLDRSVFLWAQDGQAMAKLQMIPALHAVVRSASDKVGRPWIEATFNGIRLGPKQLPEVWKHGVLAARILGLPTMPDIYVAGDQMWNTYTFGSDKSAFVVLGTAILTNFKDEELLFVLAREMGHCAAGHALWKTVTRFLAGNVGPHSVLSGGILGAISPVKLLEGAMEMPLMAWSRQSEITADRAGLLAVGDEALARRVLLAWSIRSARLLKQINIEEWMKQEDASDDKVTRFSEMATSSSMYTTRRLRLLGQAAREIELMRWSASIRSACQPPASPPRPAHASHAAARAAAPAPAPRPADSIRVVCDNCQAAMRIPFAVLKGKSFLNVRCPKCQIVLTLRSRPPASSPAPAGPEIKSAAVPAFAGAEKQAG
jgi:Zn-dependent protease with chaperone function